MRGDVQPTVESIVRIADGLEEDPAFVLRLAGILPDLLPKTTEEEEVVRIVRLASSPPPGGGVDDSGDAR